MRDELTKVRAWAKAKLDAGQEPPWAWYQYMKLVETIDAILAGMDATIPMGSSPQSDQRLERHLRLVAATDQQDNAPPHPVGLPVQLPM
jgi:hypothetical protein